MNAYGSDRVRPGQGEQQILFCKRAKGWTARVQRTYTNPEHPGTAVLWGDQYFEVVDAQAVPGGVRYLLEPWRDNNAIRLTDQYDDASEGRREAEHAASLVRDKGRKTANLLGILTGHLPAAVQDKLASDLGILPTKLTFLSLVLPFLYEIWLVNDAVRRAMVHQPLPPIGLIVIGIYLGLESVIRLNIVWTQMRPIGSAAGYLLYLLYYGLSPNRRRLVNPFEARRGEKLFYIPPSDDVALRDAIAMREPFLTLLSPPEQKRLTQKFGFDHRAQGYKIAIIILVFSAGGVVTSVMTLRERMSLSTVSALIVAVVLTGEQILRLMAMRRGPAGSILAPLVRPFARKLLE